MSKIDTKRAYILLGALLRQERNNAAKTQDDLAADLNFDRKHISRIESGAKPVSVARLLEICDVLGADPSRVISSLKERLDYEG